VQLARPRHLPTLVALLICCTCTRAPDPAQPSTPASATNESAASPAPAASAPGSNVADAPVVTATPSPKTIRREPSGPLPARYLAFTGACEPGEVVTIAAIGDVLMHHELQKQAYAAPEHFRALWSGVADLIARADLSYANLEVPIATGITKDGEAADPGLRFDNAVYTGYPFFNANPVLAEDLATTGIDVVSTANNHALDRGSLGIDRSLAALDRAKIAHAGTRRKGTKDPWHAITTAKGIRIAWLACTLHTNFGKDDHDQVLHCFKQTKELLASVRALAGSDEVDAVIVTPHWGKEYDPVPQEKQRELAGALVEAGATAVLGAHPHVLQPWEKQRAADGREAFVLYSLGNFAHHQRSLPRRSSIVLYLGLRKDASGKVTVVGARYLPIDVRMVGDKQAFFVESVDRAGGPADVRQLVVDMYGPANLIGPDDPLDVAPHCDPGWKPSK
jgi:Bacterial capsule synthesis protein PGA_cap